MPRAPKNLFWQDNGWPRLIAHRPASEDIELGSLGAAQTESLSDSVHGATDSPRLTRAAGGSPRLSRTHLTQHIRLQEQVMQPLGREYLARDVMQSSSVGMQSSDEHEHSGLRLRHHPASVSERVPSSVMMVHERRVRFQESCETIGTNEDDLTTWTWLKIKTDEANAQTAREQTEWEEVRESRGSPIAVCSSWPVSSEE